jgi:hypothetical protein
LPKGTEVKGTLVGETRPKVWEQCQYRIAYLDPGLVHTRKGENKRELVGASALFKLGASSLRLLVSGSSMSSSMATSKIDMHLSGSTRVNIEQPHNFSAMAVMFTARQNSK